MPELPEVEIVCRGLDPVMRGRIIQSVETRRSDLRKPFPRGLSRDLDGARVERISRRAKYILIHTDMDFVLVIHLGMSGRLIVEKAGYKPKAHDHMLIHMQGGNIIVFNDPRRFGIVDLIAKDGLDSHALFGHLGLEPLSNQFSGPVLSALLNGKKTSIKTAIMDQRIVVGVGNIYASESLFLAGISPSRRAGAVQGDKADQLVLAIRKVLSKAIRNGGSTLRDYRNTKGEHGNAQEHFAVYDRRGKACPGCTCDIGKTKGIKKIVQGGRSTFYCPRKQK